MVETIMTHWSCLKCTWTWSCILNSSWKTLCLRKIRTSMTSHNWWLTSLNLDFRYMKIHIFALRWRDEIKRSSQLRTLLKRVVVNRTWKKFRPVLRDRRRNFNMKITKHFAYKIERPYLNTSCHACVISIVRFEQHFVLVVLHLPWTQNHQILSLRRKCF